MARALTVVRTTGGEVKVALSPLQFEQLFAAAAAEGKPVLRAPGIAAGEDERIVLPHITSWGGA